MDDHTKEPTLPRGPPILQSHRGFRLVFAAAARLAVKVTRHATPYARCLFSDIPVHGQTFAVQILNTEVGDMDFIRAEFARNEITRLRWCA